MKKLSIAIPCYEMNGIGDEYLSQCLNSIKKQSFTDYEIIIADHSSDNKIETLVQNFNEDFDIKYFRNLNFRGNGPYNTNFAIEKCQGDIIKILFQDDILFSDLSLETIVNSLVDSSYNWLLCGFNHTSDGKTFTRSMIPKWTTYMLEGDNLLGGPTNFACKKESIEKFDDNLKLCMDTEFYHRMRYNHGNPLIISDILVSHREHSNRISNNLKYDIVIETESRSWEMIQSELDYIQSKHEEFCEQNDRRYPDELK